MRWGYNSSIVIFLAWCVIIYIFIYQTCGWAGVVILNVVIDGRHRNFLRRLWHTAAYGIHSVVITTTVVRVQIKFNEIYRAARYTLLFIPLKHSQHANSGVIPIPFICTILLRYQHAEQLLPPANHSGGFFCSWNYFSRLLQLILQLKPLRW